MINKKFIIITAIILFLGIILAWQYKQEKTVTSSIDQEEESFKEVRQSGYKFINPLLECELKSNEMGSVAELRNKASLAVTEVLNYDNKIKNISVYFRDLNNGPWFGINEKEKFSPSSLLKVPLLIAYLKQAEVGPELLLEKYLKEKEVDLGDNFAYQYFKPSQKLEIGKSYTIDELLYRMIAYSDNEAALILFSLIKPEIQTTIYNDLGIKMPEANKEDFMTVKDYASFFRILFNASYLNRDFSEKALTLLSKSEFDKGIVAGTRGNVVVAHKFGERVYQTEEKVELKQLHDCGIVYYPQHPYLLCIMSRGDDFDKLANIIKDISYLIFDYINQRYQLVKN